MVLAKKNQTIRHLYYYCNENMFHQDHFYYFCLFLSAYQIIIVEKRIKVYSEYVGIDLLFHLFQVSELFYHIPKDSESNDIINLIKERRMSRVVSLHPVTDPLVMYKMHRYYTELELNRTFVETRTLQNVIKDMLPYLPDGKLIICRFCQTATKG